MEINGDREKPEDGTSALVNNLSKSNHLLTSSDETTPEVGVTKSDFLILNENGEPFYSQMSGGRVDHDDQQSPKNTSSQLLNPEESPPKNQLVSQLGSSDDDSIDVNIGRLSCEQDERSQGA